MLFALDHRGPASSGCTGAELEQRSLRLLGGRAFGHLQRSSVVATFCANSGGRVVRSRPGGPNFTFTRMPCEFGFSRVTVVRGSGPFVCCGGGTGRTVGSGPERTNFTRRLRDVLGRLKVLLRDLRFLERREERPELRPLCSSATSLVLGRAQGAPAAVPVAAIVDQVYVTSSGRHLDERVLQPRSWPLHQCTTFTSQPLLKTGGGIEGCLCVSVCVCLCVCVSVCVSVCLRRLRRTL